MRAVFFDVDGTLTKNRVWQGLGQYFKDRGLRRWTLAFFWVYHTSLYVLYKLKIISAVGFRAPWARHMSWLFRGYTLEQVAEIWGWITEIYTKDQWREDILEILNKHKQSGDVIFLVSGGPVGLLERIALELGADHVVGTKHEIAAGTYTGRAKGEACQGENKAVFTKNLIKELGLDIDLGQSFAYADSESDIALLEMVGHPMVVYPDNEMRAIAGQRGWNIIPK